MNILFCTDGSKISYSSILNFSRWYKNIVVDILCVSDFTNIPDVLLSDYDKILQKCSGSVSHILDDAQFFLQENHIQVGNTIKVCGSVLDSILSNVKSKNYEFIVLGSNGKKGLQKWLGSVSSSVLSMSEIPVYIAKNDNNCKRILFTVGEFEDKLFDEIFVNLNLENKEVYLLNVYESPEHMFLEGNIDSNWFNDVDNLQKRDGMLKLDKFEAKLHNMGFNVKIKSVLRGVPEREILDYIDENSIDLTFLAKKQRKSFTNFVSGSVTNRVFDNTKSDICVVKI